MICSYCGKEFKPKQKTQKYCSIECVGKSQRKRKMQKCIVCGKEFLGETYRQSKYCSLHCSAVAREQNKQTEYLHRKEMLDKQRLIKKLIKCLNKRSKQLEKEINRNKTKICVCAECGSEFETKRKVKYCSDRCKKKASNRAKDKRIYRNGKPDMTISLSKLYDNHNGICQSCGIVCDWHDVIVRNDGVIIAGETYPSIDHIKPLSKGGLHSWDNVQLLCRHCNSLKRDKI